MELIRHDTKIDFVGSRFVAMGVSAVLLLIGLGSLVIKGGPNYGIDFTGGTVVHLRFHTEPRIDDIRDALVPLGMESATIQDFSDNFATGDDSAKPEYLIRLPLGDEQALDASKHLRDALQQRFGAEAFEVLRVEAVGPRVGSALRQQAILAVLFATVMMGIYVWFRFELRFGLGAAIALAHDVLLTLGALSLFNYEVDLTVVAGLLTIVGFSVNDTVIISDRIRENLRKYRRETIANIINRSINETLSRTIITTGTVMMVVLALFFLGGNVIRGFAFSLLVGFLVGTYSSIYISSPVILALEGTRFARNR